MDRDADRLIARNRELLATATEARRSARTAIKDGVEVVRTAIEIRSMARAPIRQTADEATLQRHVIEAGKHVARQRQLLRKASPEATKLARVILANLEKSLELAREHLKREQHRRPNGTDARSNPDSRRRRP